LSLVRSQIELHGGTLGIEAAPGRGTRITCRLPARHERGSISRRATATANPASAGADSLSELAI
jgi:hypothetical protein